MAAVLTPPPQFAWALLVLVYSVIVHNVWMSSGVMAARKKYGVKYPALYADKDHPHAAAFNCVQRGHQNSLEGLPSFYALFIVDSLKWPVATAILGFLYISSKVLYFQGYSTGRPELRMRGGFSHVALLSLLVMVLVWAAQLLGLVADSAVSA